MNGKAGYRQNNLLNGGELTWMGSEFTDRATFRMVQCWKEWEARLPTGQPSERWRVDMNGKRGYRQDNLLNGRELTWMGSEVTDRTTFWMVESWHEWEARLPRGQASEWWRVDMNGKRGYRQVNLLNGGELTWMGSEVTDRTPFLMMESWHELEARLPTGQHSEWWRVDMNGKRGYRQSLWWRVDMNGKCGYRQNNLVNGGELTWMGSEVTDRTTFWMVESWHELNGKQCYRQDNLLLNGGELTWMGIEVTNRTNFRMVESWHEWEARSPTGQPSEWWRVDMNGKRGYRQENPLYGEELTWMGSEVTDRTTLWMVES